MKILKHNNIEFSEVSLSELGQEMRFDADYWEPSALRNEDILIAKNHLKTKQIAPGPQYGISIAMNEEAKGYSILKMDNIMELLAEDADSKYADISKKTFEQFKLKKYDVLFNRVNSDEFVGRTGIYLLEGEHTFASYLVKVDSGKSYTNCYLTVFLNCKYGKAALQRVKRRAVNQANINAKELSNLNIPYPNETLQKELQKLLDKAQKLKNQSEQVHAEANQYLCNCLGVQKWTPQKKKFKYLDVDLEIEDTVNFEISSRDMLSNNRLDAEFWRPKYIDAFDILQNSGEYKPLSKIAEIRKGSQARPTENLDSGTPYASIKDCDNLEISTYEFTDAKKPITVNKGELVIAITGATIGKTAISNSNVPIAICGDLAAIHTDEVPQYYLLAVLSSEFIQELSKRYTTGATNGHLAVRDVAKFPIPILEKKIMDNISKKMIAYFKSRTESKRLIEVAKRAVEVFIEQDEKKAIAFIKANTK